MRGPYRKLRTRVFFHSYGPSAKREGHEEKNEVRNLRYGSSNEVNKMFIIWPFLVFVTRTERNWHFDRCQKPSVLLAHRNNSTKLCACEQESLYFLLWFKLSCNQNMQETKYLLQKLDQHLKYGISSLFEARFSRSILLRLAEGHSGAHEFMLKTQMFNEPIVAPEDKLWPGKRSKTELWLVFDWQLVKLADLLQQDCNKLSFSFAS